MWDAERVGGPAVWHETCINLRIYSGGINGKQYNRRGRLFYSYGRHFGVRHACWLCFSGSGHGAQEKPSQCYGKNSFRFRYVDVGYFFIGYSVAYGVDFLSSAATISGDGSDEAYGPQGLSLIKFFFLLTCGGHSGDHSGGIAERAKFWDAAFGFGGHCALVYPFFEGMIWNGNYGFKLGSKPASGPASMTLQVLLWCMGLAAGLLSAVILWARGLAVMAQEAALSAQLHPLAALGSGFCALAGSV